MGWFPVTPGEWSGGRPGRSDSHRMGWGEGEGREQVTRAENAERGKRSGHEVWGLPLQRLRGTPRG